MQIMRNVEQKESRFKLYKMDSEITNRCNAACPLCPRTGTLPGGVSQAVHNSGPLDLSLEHIDNICDHGPLHKFSYCGNFGDPAVHPKAFDVFKRVSDHGISTQEIHTNGGMRSKEWWTEVGKLDGKMKAVFAIDGLEDTHSMYRVNTDFHKVLENAQAFMKGGGHAMWCFIVFEHNEHQIEEARQMAYDLGFYDFTYKITSRKFGKNKNSVETKYKKSSKSDIIKKEIKAPQNEKYQASVIKKGIEEFPIVCRNKEMNQMFVTPKGQIIPCCHVHGDLYYDEYHHDWEMLKDDFFDHAFQIWLNDNNIKYELDKYGINEIMDSYNDNIDALYDLWSERKLWTCNRKCGSNNRNFRSDG